MINRLPAAASVTGCLSLSIAFLLGACSANGNATAGGSAGGSISGNGGTAGVTSSDLGGSSAAGGSDIGGTSSIGAGGATSGPPSTGGTTGNAGSGGMVNTGGAKANGGAVSTGGAKATGGMIATGGSKVASGTGNTGGSKSTGGMPATGGAKATGGSPTTGGAASTSCTFPSGWAPGSPTYTTYSMPNAQTACGYNGSNNIVANIAVGANFAAIPDGSSNFANGTHCGACVQIGSAVITIVDECPTANGQNTPCANNPTGHLDLSQAAANAAGVTGDPSKTNQAAWKYIPCPVTGNVIVRLKSGNNNEFYLENEILPIASVICAGQTGSRTSYGSWHFANNVNGQSCTATDIDGRSISFTVGNTQGQDVDTGSQFPKCS